MTPISPQKIDAILSCHAEAEALLPSGTLAPPEFVALSKELAELEPVVGAARGVVNLRGKLAELEAMLSDPELRSMAEEEIGAVRAALRKADGPHPLRLGGKPPSFAALPFRGGID